MGTSRATATEEEKDELPAGRAILTVEELVDELTSGNSKENGEEKVDELAAGNSKENEEEKVGELASGNSKENEEKVDELAANILSTLISSDRAIVAPQNQFVRSHREMKNLYKDYTVSMVKNTLENMKENTKCFLQWREGFVRFLITT